MSDDDDDDDEGAAHPETVASGTRAGTITLRPSAQTLGYLNDLIALGTHGNKPTTVANRLIDEGIRRAIKDQLIEKRRS